MRSGIHFLEEFSIHGNIHIIFKIGFRIPVMEQPIQNSMLSQSYFLQKLEGNQAWLRSSGKPTVI